MRAWIWMSLGAIAVGCSTAPNESPPADVATDVVPVPDPTTQQATDEDSDSQTSDHSDETDGDSDDSDVADSDAAAAVPEANPDEAPPETAASTTAADVAPDAVVEPAPDAAADAVADEAAEVEPTETVAPEPAGPKTYALTTKGGFVGVVVRYDRGALIAGHDHVLVASRYSGSVTWDPNDLSACKVSVDVPVSSLVVDPPGSRKRKGFKGETSAKDKATIKKNALGKNQLNGGAHPKITFRSTSCAAAGDRVLVSGKLTVRGVTKSVKTPMRISASPDRFKASGSVGFSHTQFGFKPFSAALGALKNDDKLTLDLSFVGNPG
ncbi:MAG: YceI family protein [Myxococcota bacterium]